MDEKEIVIVTEQDFLEWLLGPGTIREIEPQPEPDYGPDCYGPDVDPQPEYYPEDSEIWGAAGF